MSDSKKEREFIHALASPIAGVEMIVESMIDDLDQLGDDSAGFGERLKVVMSGIEKVKMILNSRREEVLSE